MKTQSVLSRLTMAFACLPVLALSLIHCSSVPAKPWVPPALVLILPPENTTSATNVEGMVYPMVYEKLVQRGYYCISPELARGIFNTNKLEDAGRINSLPPRKFKEVFGADAVLKVRVTQWSSYYVVLASSVSITMEMSLVATETGEVLWSGTRTESRQPDMEGEEGKTPSLLGALVKVALHSAMTDYEPIAEDNIDALISQIPLGDYKHLEPESQASGVEKKP